MARAQGDAAVLLRRFGGAYPLDVPRPAVLRLVGAELLVEGAGEVVPLRLAEAVPVPRQRAPRRADKRRRILGLDVEVSDQPRPLPVGVRHQPRHARCALWHEAAPARRVHQRPHLPRRRRLGVQAPARHGVLQHVTDLVFIDGDVLLAQSPQPRATAQRVRRQRLVSPARR